MRASYGEDEENESAVVSLGEHRCLSETELAIKVVKLGKPPFWIPKSQVSDDSEVYKPGTEGDLIVTEWFARKNELE